MRGQLSEIQRLKQSNTVLKKQNTKLRKENAQLKKTVAELENKVEELTLRIEELTQIIFGKKNKKDKDNNSKDKKERKKSKRNKSSYKRTIPSDKEVTKEEFHNIEKCPDCNEKLRRKRVIEYYEENISFLNENNKIKEIIKHHIEKGYCPKCKKWHSAIPIPSSPVMIGKNTRIYVCYLSILLRLSFQQIKEFFRDTCNFKISDGEISKILEKESKLLRPEYERLKERIRNQKGVHYDETSWKVQKENQGHYAWSMSGTESEEVVFDLGKSRGKGVAEKLKANSNHIGISDDYGVYRNLFEKHQLCWAHPHRKLRDLAFSDKLNEKTKQLCTNTYQEFKSLYNDLSEELEKEFNFKERQKIKEKLSKRFDEISIEKENEPKKLTSIKLGLRKNKEKYFTCLLHEGIPADNNKAERNLRHLVLKRKISFGSKTQAGAERLSILLSVLYSTWKMNPNDFFGKMKLLREEV